MMMLNKNDQERVTQLLTDAITVLCKNGLNYDSQFCIEGLLGITLDEREVFLVKIDETVRGHGATAGNPVESPTGITHQRTAVTSPRRGAKPRVELLSHLVDDSMGALQVESVTCLVAS